MSSTWRSDEALLEAWREGRIAAFDALYARYEGPLFGFILQHLSGDTAEAEDVLHHAFLALLREARGAKRIVSVRALVYEIARNVCLNRLRTGRRAARALAREEQLAPAPPEQPDALLATHQGAAALERALSRMPTPLSEVYRLRASGLSYDEVAQLLGVPLGTVKSRLHEVVTRLRQELNP